MKNKTKLMLALSILTAGTLAAGATGTFAWFTTNKTASANYTQIKAQGTTSDLKVSIGGVTEGAGSSTGEASSSATATGGFTSDVSSNDGINFYQPDWKSTAGNDKNAEFNSILVVSERTGYFTQFTVTLELAASSTNTTDKYNISLVGVSITGDSELAGWTRVAINSIANKSASKKFLEVGANNSVYLFQTSGNTIDKKYIDSTKIETATNMEGVLSDCTPTISTAVNSENKITPDAWKGQTQGSKITLGVSVWMEGTMNGNNTQNGALTQTVGVGLTFAAQVVNE